MAWCPTCRRPVIEGAVDARLQQIIREVCAERDCTTTELHTMPDHLHLLAECNPQDGIHRLVTLVKEGSSRLLRDESPSLTRRLPTSWANSHVVATLGNAPWEIIQQYVENQPTK